MIKKQEILKFVSTKEDKIIYSKALDQLIFCEKNYEQTFTDFLPQVKIGEFLEHLKKYNIEQNIKIFGGYDGSERSIIGFSPDYLEITQDNFPISILEIKYNKKYSKELKHRDFLGAIIGIGIDRTKLGDIIIQDSTAICFVEKYISSYIEANLEKVSNTKVKVEKAKEYNVEQYEYEQKVIIVPSFRVDAVLSTAFNLSRSKISDIIKEKKVFINWNLEISTSKHIKENDIITVRGFGRIKILDILGKTKKERYILNIIKYT